jgi:hypothetical protein
MTRRGAVRTPRRCRGFAGDLRAGPGRLRPGGEGPQRPHRHGPAVAGPVPVAVRRSGCPSCRSTGGHRAVSITFLHSRADRDDTPVDGRVELTSWTGGPTATRDPPSSDCNRKAKPARRWRASTRRSRPSSPRRRIIDAWTDAGRPRLEGPIHLRAVRCRRPPAGPLPQGRQPDGRPGWRKPYARPAARSRQLPEAGGDALNGRLYARRRRHRRDDGAALLVR